MRRKSDFLSARFSLIQPLTKAGLADWLPRLPVMLNNAPPSATIDCLPEDNVLRRRMEACFVGVAESYGFQEISTPMFERADLFTARSGPEIKNSLLTFHCDHEEYALRPEMTAPVCRLVASGVLQQYTLPYKLFYVAPCFRYCRPHSGRRREFLQAGIELLGESSVWADAEVIAASCRFLRSIGIHDYKLKVGTARIFRDLLPKELDPDDRAVVIGHLDRLISIDESSKVLAVQSEALLLEQLRMIRGELATLQDRDGYTGNYQIADHPDLSVAELAQRLPLEAAETFRHLWNIEGYMPGSSAELLIQVSRMRGTLKEVSSAATELLSNTSASESLEDLMSVCSLLQNYGIDNFEVGLGIARGLTFYTGCVFEISSQGKKLCGGGRYDKLVELFGGAPTPATGSALRFDTLQELVTELAAIEERQEIRLIPSTQNDLPTAVQLAEQLRDSGLQVGSSGAKAATVSKGQVQLAGKTVDANVTQVLQALRGKV